MTLERIPSIAYSCRQGRRKPMEYPDCDVGAIPESQPGLLGNGHEQPLLMIRLFAPVAYTFCAPKHPAKARLFVAQGIVVRP